MMTSEIIRLDKSQIDKASQVLAAAFSQDPMFQYILSQQDKAKDKLLYSFWKASLQYCQYYNCIYTTPELKGIAIWLPPGEFPLNFLRFLRVGFYKVAFRLAFGGLGKSLSLLTLFEEYHKQDMSVPRLLTLL